MNRFHTRTTFTESKIVHLLLTNNHHLAGDAVYNNISFLVADVLIENSRTPCFNCSNSKIDWVLFHVGMTFNYTFPRESSNRRTMVVVKSLSETELRQ